VLQGTDKLSSVHHLSKCELYIGEAAADLTALQLRRVRDMTALKLMAVAYGSVLTAVIVWITRACHAQAALAALDRGL